MNKKLNDENSKFRSLLEDSGLFNHDWYISKYADVRQINVDPFEHFLEYGYLEHRNPGPNFDSEYYSIEYPDYKEKFSSPIEHYLYYGKENKNNTIELNIYQKWIDKYAILNEQDILAINKDSDNISKKELISLLIIGEKEYCYWIRSLHSLVEQIGISLKIFCVRGKDLTPEKWSTCISTCETFRQVRALDSIEDVLLHAQDGDIFVVNSADVLLEPHACYIFNRAIKKPNIIASYCDHDRIDESNRRHSPIFKPALSPEYIKYSLYIGKCIAFCYSAKTFTLFLDLFISNNNSACEVIFSLFMLELEKNTVRNVSFILYHDLNDSENQKNCCYEPILAHNSLANNQKSKEMQIYRSPYKVDIIIPSRDRVDLLSKCIDSIWNNTYYPIEYYSIIVADNESRTSEAVEYFEYLENTNLARVVKSRGQFNFSRICNDAVSYSKADIIVIMNNDIKIIDNKWLLKMVSYACLSDIGVVGCKLLYPDDTIQHGGVVLGVGGAAVHRFVKVPEKERHSKDCNREMVAVTGACIATRRKIFWEVEGFDQKLGTSFNDVLFCANVYKKGYKNIYISDPLMYHYESKSRGYDNTFGKIVYSEREATYLRKKIPELIKDDPSYSPNLSFDSIGEIAFPPRIRKPWRQKSNKKGHVLLLCGSSFQEISSNIYVINQVIYFQLRNWVVTIGLMGPNDPIFWLGCEVKSFDGNKHAVNHAVETGVDALIIHDHSFIPITKYVGNNIIIYVMRYNLKIYTEEFKHNQARYWQKISTMSRRIFTPSYDPSICEENGVDLSFVPGNTHLLAWDKISSISRKKGRTNLSLVGKFIIVLIDIAECKDKLIQIVREYSFLATEIFFEMPRLNGKLEFIIINKYGDKNIYLQNTHLRVFSIQDDSELYSVLNSSDLILSFDNEVCYGFLEGQSRAMGLPRLRVTEAISVSLLGSGLIDLFNAIDKLTENLDEEGAYRSSKIETWDLSSNRIIDLIEQDLDEYKLTYWL